MTVDRRFGHSTGLFTANYSYPGYSPTITLSGNGSNLFVTGDNNGSYLTAAYRL